MVRRIRSKGRRRKRRRVRGEKELVGGVVGETTRTMLCGRERLR